MVVNAVKEQLLKVERERVKWQRSTRHAEQERDEAKRGDAWQDGADWGSYAAELEADRDRLRRECERLRGAGARGTKCRISSNGVSEQFEKVDNFGTLPQPWRCKLCRLEFTRHDDYVVLMCEREGCGDPPPQVDDIAVVPKP